MKINLRTKMLALLLATLTLFGSFASVPVDASAACDFYVETLKGDVPLWSEPTKFSTKIDELKSGKVLHIVDEAYNEYEHLWYKTQEGYWVFSENVKDHNHMAVMCGQPGTSYEAVSDKEHNVYFYNGDELCKCGYKVANGTTTSKTEAHKFEGTVCKSCGYIFTREFTENTAYVKLKEDCDIYSEPTKYSLEIGSLYKGDSVLTVGTVFNEHGNVWYKTESGGYFYDGHVDHVHMAVMCGQPSTYSYEAISDKEHTAYFYNGDELCSCGFKVGEGSTTTITDSHSFVQNICKYCSYYKEVETTTAYVPPETTKAPATTAQSSKPQIIPNPFVTTTAQTTTKADSSDSQSGKPQLVPNPFVTTTAQTTTKAPTTTATVTTTEKNNDTGNFVCVDYESCTSNGSKIYIITEDNCPIREQSNSLGRVASRARKGQLISVKRVFWTWRLTRWAELNVPGSDKPYYIYIGNCEEHIIHEFVEAVTTDAGKISYCVVCGVALAETQNKTVSSELLSIGEQVLLGSFSDEQASFISIAAQISVSEIPYVGAAADLRDVIGDIMTGQSAEVIVLDSLALAPFVAMFKSVDEIVLITKNQDELLAAFKKTGKLADIGKYTALKLVKTNLSVDEFSKAKKLGKSYTLTDARFAEHIELSHGYNSAVANKTKFSRDIDIKEAIDETLKNPDAVLKNTEHRGVPRDGYIYRKDFGYVIGTDPETGRSLTEIRVVLNPDGSVNTAFPDAQGIEELFQ